MANTRDRGADRICRKMRADAPKLLVKPFVRARRWQMRLVYGSVVLICALVMLTSVLLTTPLAFTSFRKFDAVTGDDT